MSPIKPSMHTSSSWYAMLIDMGGLAATYHMITSLGTGLCSCINYAMKPSHPGTLSLCLLAFPHQMCQLSLKSVWLTSMCNNQHGTRLKQYNQHGTRLKQWWERHAASQHQAQTGYLKLQKMPKCPQKSPSAAAGSMGSEVNRHPWLPGLEMIGWSNWVGCHVGLCRNSNEWKTSMSGGMHILIDLRNVWLIQFSNDP